MDHPYSQEICLLKFHKPTSRQLNLLSDRRVDSTDEITSVLSLTDEIQKPKFSHYLFFVVSVKTNLFVYKLNEKYSSQQEEMFNLIQSLHNSG